MRTGADACTSKREVVAAMGIGTDGRKRMPGVIEGGSENSDVVKALLAGMLERGLDPTEPRLYVLDGSKAWRKRSETRSGTGR